MPLTYQPGWTCSLCGSRDLLAHTHAHCPNCGHGYDGEPVRYPAWDELKPSTAHRFHGSSWTCCGHGWAALARHCGCCGRSGHAVQPVPVAALVH